MLAAMRWRPRTTWIFAACDMPLLQADAVRWLLSERRPGRWAVLPRVSDAGVEPLLALYEPQSRALLEELVGRGLAAPRHIIGDPAVATPAPPASLASRWANANTPEELARIGGLDT